MQIYRHRIISYEGWARDETSYALNPIPPPSHVSPVPKDVMKMIRGGCSSTQPCSTTRCRCSAATLYCSMFWGCPAMKECLNDQTKSVSESNNEDTDEDEY